MKFEHKKCDNCNSMLENGDKVTVLIPEVEVCGKYRRNHQGFRLKLSKDGIDPRTAKIYCSNCLDVNKHFLEG